MDMNTIEVLEKIFITLVSAYFILGIVLVDRVVRLGNNPKYLKFIRYMGIAFFILLAITFISFIILVTAEAIMVWA